MRIHTLVIAIFVTSHLATSASAQIVYDAYTDFNTASNTNSDLWSYRFEDPRQTDVTLRAAEPALLPSVNAHYGGNWTPGPDVQGWNNGGVWPGILINDSGVEQTFFGVIPVPADTVYTTGIADMGIGGVGGSSVLSFLVPTTGIYNIDFSMTHNHGEFAGDGERFFIDHHSDIVGGVSSSQTLLAEGTTSPAAPLDIPAGTNPDGTVSANLTNVPLSVDDRVNFVIDILEAGNSDGVFFAATLNSTDGTLPTERAWNVDRSDNWNVGGHWTPIGIPNGNDQTVTFGGAITQPRIVFTEEDVTVKEIQFLSGNTYTIAGTGSVNLEAGTPPANIGVLLGDHQFQAEVNLNSDVNASISTGTSLTFNNTLSLNGNTLTKTGGGDLEIRNTLVTGGGTVDVQAGTVFGNGTVGGDLINSDGTVSPGDGAASLLAVPEPCTWLMLVCGILGVVSCTGRGRLKS